MSAYKELKLMVYESALSKDEIDEVIDLMESCDDEDLQEVCESVEAFVTEANAYNKLANKYRNDMNKQWERSEVFKKLGHMDLSDKNADKALAINAKARKDGIDLDDYRSKGIRDDNDRDNTRDYQKFMKREWMLDHGNKGESPKEKYKAGRYLEAQKKLKEINNKYKR